LTKWYNHESSKENKYKEPICLVDALERFKPSQKPNSKPQRICIYDYFNRGKDGFSWVTGDCCTVKIESGMLLEGSQLLLMPLNEMVTIKAIEHNKEKTKIAFSG
jgi:elongation factor 1 alpha-like protein